MADLPCLICRCMHISSECFTCPGCSVLYCNACAIDTILSQRSVHITCLNGTCKTRWTKSFILNSVPWDNTSLATRQQHELDNMMHSQQQLEQNTLHVVEILKEIQRIDAQLYMTGYREVGGVQDVRDVLLQRRADLEELLTEIESQATIHINAQRSSTHPFTIPCGNLACSGCLPVTSNDACLLCGTNTCRRCRHCIYSCSDHLCRDEDLRSIELISCTTAACPTCGVHIEKVQGTCNDMFCTRCTTEFNYRTQEPTSRAAHQPQRHQFLAEGGSLSPHDIFDLPDFPTGDDLLLLFERFDLSPRFDDIYYRALMRITRIRSLLLEAYRMANDFSSNLLRDVCILPRATYLLGDTSKLDFSSIVYQRVSLQRMQEEVRDVMMDLINESREIYRQLMQTNNMPNLPLDTFHLLFDGLSSTANRKLYLISKAYNMCTPSIPIDYKWSSKPSHLTYQMWSDTSF